MRKAPCQAPVSSNSAPSLEGLAYYLSIGGGRRRHKHHLLDGARLIARVSQTMATTTAPSPPVLPVAASLKSRGRRNTGCVGTNRGNGGVKPPGTYKRRRDILDPDERHDKWYRRDWQLQLAEALKVKKISARAFKAGNLLSTFSSDTGVLAFAAQATIGGNQDGQKATTINRGLAELREQGMLEWEHRFLPPEPGHPYGKATSCLYAFRFNVEFCSKFETFARRLKVIAGIATPRPQRPKRHVGGGKRHTSPADQQRPTYVASGEHLSSAEQLRRERQRAAESLIDGELTAGASFDELVQCIDNDWQDIREWVYAYLEERWRDRSP